MYEVALLRGVAMDTESGFFNIPSIEDQVGLLSETYGLDGTSALECAKRFDALPDGAEGLFAFPYGGVNWLPYHYGDGGFLAMVSALSGFGGSCYNWFNSTPVSRCPHQEIRKPVLEALGRVRARQVGDILVVPAQFGQKYSSDFVQYDQVRFAKNEFGFTGAMGAVRVLGILKKMSFVKDMSVPCFGDIVTKPQDKVRGCKDNGVVDFVATEGLFRLQIGVSNWNTMVDKFGVPTFFV